MRSRKKKGSKPEAQHAIVTLRPESWLDPKNAAASAADEVARAVLERVERKCGTAPERVKVFSNLGSMAIAADARFLEQLAAEPEILRSDPNLRQESMKIEPRRKRPVDFHGKPRKR